MPTKSNLIKHNARNRKLIGIECAVCLTKTNPGNLFYCRTCDAGIVCNHCITKIDKVSPSFIYTPNFGDTIDIRPNAEFETKFDTEVCSLDPTIIIRENPDCLIEGVGEDGDKDTFFKKLQQLIWLTKERGAPWGYGNSNSQSAPMCPCCRAEFSFFAKGVQMKQDENFRLEKMRPHYFNKLFNDKFIKELQQQTEEPYDTIENNKALCKWYNKSVVNHIDTETGKAKPVIEPNEADLSGFNTTEYDPAVPYRSPISLYQSLGSDLERKWSSNTIWTDVKALMMCAEYSPDEQISKELLECIAKSEEVHHASVAALKGFVSRAHEFKFLEKIDNTINKNGKESLEVVHRPVHDRIKDFLNLFCGYHVVGLPNAPEPTKALPAKIDNIMIQFQGMTKQEQIQLIQQINAT